MVDFPLEKHDAPVRLLAAFQQVHPLGSPTLVVQAPGREIWIAATTDTSGHFSLNAPDVNGRTRFSWRSAKFKRTVLRRPLPSWSRYPAGVVVALCGADMEVTGLNAVLIAEEATGPRFDFGLGVAVAALLHELHNRPYTPDSLVDIIEKVRRDYIES